MNKFSIEEWFARLESALDLDVLLAWATVLVASLLVTTVIKIVLKVVVTRLSAVAQRTTSIWDDVAVELLSDLRPWVLFAWMLFTVTKAASIFAPAHKALLLLVVIATSYQAIVWGLYVIKAWRQSVLDKRIEQDPSSAAAIGLFYTSARAALVVTIVLIALSNLGINVSAVLAGLGVGGIAVALAAQNILGDLLASLSIVLDKPFVVGDFIVSGEVRGTVEYIGIKTTRLRALTGEQVVLSNKSLLESQIHNFKRIWQRRALQRFGVVYSTSYEALQKIPGWVKEIVQRYDKLTFDRCHFFSYGASSLDYELVFFVSDPEYNVLMDLQERVLLDIFKKFSDEQIEFAFPTQTLHVETVPVAKSHEVKSQSEMNPR